MIKKALIVLIHCIINIVIQMAFSIRMIFFYDYSVSDIVSWSAIGIGLTVIDYFACMRILKERIRSAPWIIHSADLVLAIPNVALRGYGFYLDKIDKDIIKPSYSHYEIAWIIGILLVDVCLILERISLIKRNH